MTHTRLDNQCRAKVLAIYNDRVLITAHWPASSSDHRRFPIQHDRAFNTVEVSKAYFERKYGVVL
jgi:hypothetical protein